MELFLLARQPGPNEHTVEKADVAMTQQPRTTNFRLEVQRRNWTWTAFALQWRNACEDLARQDREPRLAHLPLSKRTFQRWMNGEVAAGPRRSAARVLEHLFGLPVEHLMAAPKEGTYFSVLVRQRNWSYPAFASVWKRSREELARLDGDPRLARIDVPRRTFVHWMSGDIAGPPRPDAARILEYIFGLPVAKLMGRPPTGADQHTADAGAPRGLAHPGAALGDGVSHGMQRVASETIDSIVDRYESQGPQQLAGETLLLRKVLHTMMAASPRPQTDHLVVASKTSGLLAYMAVNAGQHQLAERYCTEADSLAIAAGETPLRMWIQGTRALNFYYMGDYQLSHQAAEAGVALGPRSAHAIRLLANGQARALARLGDSKGAGHAVARALSLSERQLQLPQGITSCISFAPYSYARTLANAITAHLSAGDVKRVLQYAGEIEGLVAGSDSQWTKALVGLDVATALLQQPHPDVEHAIFLGQAAVRAGNARPIESVRQRAGELLDRASRWRRERPVREYAEELVALERIPPPELVSANAP
ncbi:hypothetical protein AB0N81_11060 [Streptomyces sp. NPDC093510]|uniref:hypothetical protein n=1 Tax=Streptomyces sp. NPDC093510 TaxID=3155199 RepID=UPI00341D1867